jgi:hypothetical protein
VLTLTDASGQPLAHNDDCEDPGAGLTTHHADSRLSIVLPSDGVAWVRLGDTQRHGGLEYAYRLRLSPPRPDFALRLVPASINVRGGGTVPLTVYALRKDGFTNEIRLVWKNAPAGFSLSGARVPAGQDQVRITLSAPALDPPGPLRLDLEGRATVEGREVVHRAVPAEDRMQAFAYRHLVPAQEPLVAVNGRSLLRLAPRVLSSTPVRIPLGGTARVRVGAPGRAIADRFQLELSEPPEGLTLQAVEPSRDGAELVLRCDATQAKAGREGNLIVSLFAGGGDGTGRPRANPRRVALATLPAIPFVIVAVP